MAMKTSVDDERALAPTAALFRVLGEPARLSILRHLELGPHRVVDLVEHLGLAQSTVSKHLSVLRESGLVTSTPRGRATEFTLVADVSLVEVFAAADRVLGEVG